MLAVRYIALMALVFWVGGLAGAVFGDLIRHTSLLAYACGGTILVGLLIMKFVGPPPHGFVPRIAITAVMLAVAVVAATRQAWSAILMPATMALGFVLLGWYVRE